MIQKGNRMQSQRIINLNLTARYVIGKYFPEFISCYLKAEFMPVEKSITEVHHIYPFEDNRYRGEIVIHLDESIRDFGIKAIIGGIAHDMAHRVGWKGPGYPLASDREADNIAIERGLGCYLLEAKKALEQLRPGISLKGYSSKELEELLSHNIHSIRVHLDSRY
jgi:hypothetical protein